MAGVDERTSLAFFAESEILEIEQDGVREVVVGLEYVHVGGLDAGHAEGFTTGDNTRSDGEIGTLRDMPLDVRFSGTDDAHGPLASIACPFAAGDDDDAATIRDEAAVELVQRIAD